MRFIGQYIQSLIARFRNDVYLEDISTGTIASGGNLGLDSNNKIVKATVSASNVDLTTDVTGVLPSANLDADTAHLSVAQSFTAAKTFATDTKLQFREASAYINSPTADDLEISATDITLDAAGPVYLDAGAGNAITFQEAGTTIADITAHHAGTYLNMYENEGASTDDFFSIGVEAAGATTIATVDDSGSNGANLVFNVQGTFSVASTGIDIATNGTITNATWQGDAIATTYTAAKVTSIVAGEGVDVSGATGDVTISGEDATTSNKGIASFSSDNFDVSSGAVTIKSGGVDLAAEVTGVLPTANQKHLAYFEFKGYGTGDGTNYEMPEVMTDQNAPFEHNTSTGSNGLTAQTIQTVMRSGGVVMPYTGVLKKFQGWATSAGSGTVNIALFKFTPTDDTAGNLTPVQLVNESITASGNAIMNSFSETSSFDAGFTAGDIIYPAVLGINNKAFYFNSTLVVEWS